METKICSKFQSNDTKMAKIHPASADIGLQNKKGDNMTAVKQTAFRLAAAATA